MEYNTFSDCEELGEVELPSSIKRIGYECFANCKSLKQIHYLGKDKEWKKIEFHSSWKDGSNLKTIKCRNQVITLD